MTGTVAAIVLSWNDGERVLPFLHRLYELDVTPDHLVVVDNGSRDGTPDRIADALPRCEIVRLPENRGFAGAVNCGIQRALARNAEWIWLLNTDIVLPRDTLVMLTAAAREDRCGMAAPVLVESNGNVQSWGGGHVNMWTGIARHARSGVSPPHYLSGACLLLRAAMVREIGMLDESYFFYWEDVEFGFRARQHRWSLAVAVDCRVQHLEGSALGRWSRERWRLLLRGVAIFLEDRAPLPLLAVALRLLHHTASMARHRRWDALCGGWIGTVEGRALARRRRAQA